MKLNRVTRFILAAAVMHPAAVTVALAQGGPQVTLSTTSIDFGRTYVGAEPGGNVVATNTGDATLTITNDTVTGAGFTPSFDNMYCLKSFAPGSD